MTKPYIQSGEPLNDFLGSFWQRQADAAERETLDYRHPPLPLARIKKVMKSDPDVKMIAADAPILFCKACEIFISEITARAFVIADTNKRRTLSRADIAKALGKSDQFDFLIDVVPRDEVPFSAASTSTAAAAAMAMAVVPTPSPDSTASGGSASVSAPDGREIMEGGMMESESTSEDVGPRTTSLGSSSYFRRDNP